MAHAATTTSFAYPTSECSTTGALRSIFADLESTDPAYTAVSVRQGFGQYGNPSASAPAGFTSPITPVPQPPPAESPKVVWPESVRQYVQRSFMPQNEDPSVSRAEVEAKLKATIGAAKENGTMHTIDWDSLPLPQVLVRSERSVGMNDANARKRKSSDLHDDAHPPWRNNTNSRSALENRISQPPTQGKRANLEETSGKLSKSQKDANKRKRRFEAEYVALRSPSPPPAASGPIVGTCETLEKKYLRLTAPPVPAKVRPQRILTQTLDLVKRKWRKEGNYSYICDQFKSMRQDLTVQHIKNEFTVSVYEIHARIALEKGDIGEYNQCQTQLRSLYAMGLKGNPIEFKAYRILYFIHTANRSGLNDTLADLTAAEKEEWPIKHALSVRSAIALGNYHKVFQLYLDTPNMGAYLMDMFVVRERLAALCNICRA